MLRVEECEEATCFSQTDLQEVGLDQAASGAAADEATVTEFGHEWQGEAADEGEKQSSEPGIHNRPGRGGAYMLLVFTKFLVTVLWEKPLNKWTPTCKHEWTSEKLLHKYIQQWDVLYKHMLDDGMKWNGMEWKRKEWNEMEWNGMQ